MSKPIVRVVVAVLICLGIVAAVSPSVQARLGNVFQQAETNTAANSSTITDGQTLKQGTVKERVPASSQFNDLAPSDSSHECNSDPTLDY